MGTFFVRAVSAFTSSRSFSTALSLYSQEGDLFSAVLGLVPYPDAMLRRFQVVFVGNAAHIVGSDTQHTADFLGGVRSFCRLRQGKDASSGQGRAGVVGADGFILRHWVLFGNLHPGGGEAGPAVVQLRLIEGSPCAIRQDIVFCGAMEGEKTG